MHKSEQYTLLNSWIDALSAFESLIRGKKATRSFHYIICGFSKYLTSLSFAHTWSPFTKIACLREVIGQMILSSSSATMIHLFQTRVVPSIAKKVSAPYGVVCNRIGSFVSKPEHKNEKGEDDIAQPCRHSTWTYIRSLHDAYILHNTSISLQHHSKAHKTDCV